MTSIRKVYEFDDKSKYLKFIDNVNKNFYKLVNGKKYTLISTSLSNTIILKSYQLTACEKTIKLVKCLAIFPFLSVTIILKIINKENKLAAKRFENFTFDKFPAKNSAEEENNSVPKRNSESRDEEDKLSFESAAITRDPARDINAKNSADEEDNSVSRRSEKSIGEGQDRDVFGKAIRQSSGYVGSKSDDESRYRNQSRPKVAKRNSLIYLSPKNYIKHPQEELYDFSSDDSSDYQTPLNSDAREEEPQSSAAKMGAFVTNQVAPMILQGAAYLLNSAVKSIVQDGAVYAVSALTGVPPEDLCYGMQVESSQRKLDGM